MSGSILGEISREATAKSVETSAPDQVSETLQDIWYWDSNTPGQGPRPEWLDSKFKSVADKARSHSELEKRLFAGEAKEPENYDLAKFEGKFDSANEHIGKFIETAKRNRLQQDSVHEILDTLVAYEESQRPNIDAEIAKLGPQANQKIETVRRWAATHLSEEACEVLGQISNRAEVINFIDEVRQLALRGQAQPPSRAEPQEAFERYTLEDWEAELAIPANAKRYTEDGKYRAQMQSKLKVIYGEE